ncbi:hypothetical protein [Kineosporia sp. NBRC 101731]|uniref:hypothetical protein n=1 Tax=Kineosporia sp. NBRC 101731 TaxID=3032199 RepID=UPI002556CCA8|nr:hypothetical protein [Kineosporia sp. NBRC 101731]
MSLAPNSDAGRADLFSTSTLPAVVGGGPDSGGLSLSAASVGAALRATGAPLDVAAVPSSSPASGSLPTADPELGPSTEPYTVQPEPASVPAGASSFGASSFGASSFGASASAGSGASGAGRGGQPQQQSSRAAASSGQSESSGQSGQAGQGGPSGQGGGRPGRRSPDTGAFVPREMVARRRAAEAMTRAIVMAPPLPPSMMTGSQPMPGVQNPASGPITQPGGPETHVDPAAAAAAAARAQVQPGAKNRKRKGRKQGAHTAGIPMNTGANQQVQPPTGQLPTAPGTGSMPIGYNNPQGYAPQGYPQGYAPQGYTPQGYPQTYAPQAYAPQGYQQQGYQQQVPTGSMPVSAMGSVGVPTAPPQQQLYQGRPPRQPNQKLPSPAARWAMFAVVCLVIGGIIAGVMISLGAREKDPNAGGGNTTATPTATATQAVETVSLDFDTQPFDPVSGNGIKDDGDAYRTMGWYNSAQFGNLKPGVGLLIDLGKAKKVSKISVNVGGQPITVGLRSANSLSTSSLDDYDTVVKQKKVTGKVDLNASSADAQRYWLIWVTSLAPRSDGKFDATLKNLKVTGPKE